jgi:hypothetical protein
MSLISSRYGLAMMESESTYNTDEIDASYTANAAVVFQDFTDLMITPVAVQWHPATLRGSASQVPHVQIKDQCTVTASGMLRGWISGGAGEEAPYYSPLLTASTLSETVVAATSATYAPATTQQGSVTVYKYERNLEDDNYRLITATGVRLNTTINFAINQEATWTATGVGASFEDYSAPAAFISPTTGQPALRKDGLSATTSTAAYADADPMVCQSMTITVGGNTYNCSEVTLDFGYTPTPIQTVNPAQTTSSVIGLRNQDSRPSGTFQLLDGGTAYSAALTDWVASNQLTIDIRIANSTSRIDFTAPYCQIARPEPGDQAGVRAYAINYFLAGDFASSLAGNNDFALQYRSP